MTDAADALFGDVEATCLKCGRDMASVRTDAGSAIAVLQRVECPTGHTGTVKVRHDSSVAADTRTLYHGAAAPGGVAE